MGDQNCFVSDPAWVFLARDALLTIGVIGAVVCLIGIFVTVCNID